MMLAFAGVISLMIKKTGEHYYVSPVSLSTMAGN
jgi:hypothetical protein